ncbi:MAG: DUF4112 domain-containing protein [Candidatus Binatia bacterium]
MMNPSNEERRVTRLDKLSRLLDTAFRIPGTDFRIGLDGILGLIPGVGDTLGAVLSSYIIVEAARLGLPKRILIRMIGNVAIESIAGAVPILGDIFDIAWKANIKNFALLRTHLAARSPKERSSRQITRLIVGAMILVVIALATISILVAAFFIRLLTG